ncbi:Uncharacterised protein (plasmid) [Tsukamurella tyrosinosolvens]|uniref:Lipoprotein n=1 Tax=Tsukamurella tyrosinosolvens TaxID=57704 RepID=A0A1H4UFX0_TSUTY|nr:hypothetical protein [Tsukamurella tyrosinosolvens]KXO92928.1 hypothetical protein AXK58_13740 [Tsukamurella tyrosinosolvens]SEC67676.1 hypothetical protein SAMN04489793_2890 [Tsukamurella tyrosinosolvens]VEH94201.1 Uncharacterised protein [Tsukamurella tyrosinosolvens]
MNTWKKYGAAGAVVLVALALASCENNAASNSEQYKKVEESAGKRQAYQPRNDVEFNNYNEAQKLYDEPNTIQWCTATWSNGSAPLFTVPIKGKLTSSSVSYYPSQELSNSDGRTYNPELRSVDGMYHGNPPAYRYGFTPGGVYVDFSGMEVMCSTQPMKFQRQDTKITYEPDPQLADAQRRAQEALKAGNPDEAQRILQEALK